MGFTMIRISGSVPELIKRQSEDIEYNTCDQKRKLSLSIPESTVMFNWELIIYNSDANEYG
ncbi:hypothetical protein ACJMK2_022372 [Sinanodonta woodiana]|uniref:Uncharacterized protein n=1 Tax=Sinanodonta woodiana TaxID=1069815 RepID=A0ABD3TJT8_SINWO